MKLIDTPISILEIKKMSDRMFGGLVKAVIDVENEILVVDAAMHADEEAFLLQHGSKQENLWGINLYPELSDDEFLEFDSMINIRPNQHNMSRIVEDEKLRQKIRSVVKKMILFPKSDSE